MMARRHQLQYLGLCLAVGLVMVSSICIRTQAQSISGFVSIDCGSSAPYNDTVNQFLWESDDGYVLTGTNAEIPGAVNASENSQALKTFRYFPDPRSKHCYKLNLTTSNVSVLIRAMFLHGDSPVLNLPITFDVYVNSTPMYTVTYGIYDTPGILNSPIVIEGIFPCPGSVIYVCLVPKKGIPFISSLELRQFDPDGLMYGIATWSFSTVWPGVWLFNLLRLNCGAPPNSSSVRYPDDKYDRLWNAPMDNRLQALTQSTATPSATSSTSINNVPPKVMEDAWLNDTANSSFQFAISGLDSSILWVYAAVYTEEIQSYPSGDRVFSASANGEDLGSKITASSDPALDYTNDLLFENTTLRFVFEAATSSVLGPIVNAIEAYAVHDSVNSSTLPQDVYALADLQNSFNLTDWEGDPCEPVPWDWLDCTSITSSEEDGYVARVTKLLLSSKGINSTIPLSISQLDVLTEIHLDNNSLYGTIPDSLASLQNLTLLLLNDNDLSGEVPQVLETKLGSNFSYSGNMFLTAFSPNGAPSNVPNGAPSHVPNAVPPSTNKKNSSNIGVLVGAVAGGVLALGVLLLIFIRYRKCCRSTGIDHPPIVGNAVGYVSYEAVRIATDDFKEKIGQGGYGSVYRGRLDGREVAVKINNIQCDQGQNEFINEVDILTRVHHRNLVSLIGYCNEGKELILIYEYQVNGTLREWLYDEEKTRGTLDWAQRLQIAADGARGLEYLHKRCNPTIIHRDVKSSNILLDDTLTAKVADFGLSKATTREGCSGVSTLVKGTRGYLDPEYYILGKLTHKSDVYSYGVVIAELITGQPPFKSPTGSASFVLLEWLRDLVKKKDILGFADKSLGEKFNPKSMSTMAEIALSCVDPVGENRPDFSQIVQDINEAIKLEIGPARRKLDHSQISQGTQSATSQDSSNLTGSSSLEIDSNGTSPSQMVERYSFYSLRSRATYQNLR